MRTSSESRIEDFAIDYLKAYYVQQPGAKDIVAYVSEQAKNGVTADGLFVFKTGEDESLVVAALQTEPSDKIKNLLVSFKAGKYKLILLLFALLSSAATALVIHKLSQNLALTGALSFVLIPCFYFTLVYAYRILLRNKLAGIIRELKRLPANERWLGISISSRNLKRNKLASDFLANCKKKGVGVITVGTRSKVVLVTKPFTYNRRTGDFLSFYKSEIDIRKDMLGDNLMRIAKG